MKLVTINDSIFNHTQDYMCHQCNCITVSALGLAKAVFEKYPNTNTYKNRIRNINTTFSKPGTIDIFPEDKIINIYSQFFPGKSKDKSDTNEKRIEWLKQCLQEIINQIPNLKSLAIPYHIGCNLAGGDWPTYVEIFTEFSHNNNIEVVIYHNN